jgi:hypothetical protein
MTTRTLVWFFFLLFLIGIAVAPDPFAATHPSPAATARVDDFEDRDLVTAAGHSWIPLADDQFGGATT